MAVLGGGITTYRTGRDRPAAAGTLAATLRDEGYTLDAAGPIAVSVLDTFDGRLAAAGLRLELTTSGGRRRVSQAGELVLRGSGGGPARAAVTGRPEVAADVPGGPLRIRLARLLDVRVLLALVTVDATRTVATRRNGSGKATAVAIVYDSPNAGGIALDGPLVDVVELTGYPKPADDLRAVLVTAGMSAIEGGVVDLAASAAGVDLTGQSVTPGVPLDADGRAIDGFRAVLTNLRDAIVLNWDGTVADTDPEFLHDLRVAVRRTRSVLANAKNIVPSDVRRRARDDFGWFGQITGAARDLDVYQIEWPAYTGPLTAGAAAALEPIRAHLDGERQLERRRLAEELTGAAAGRIIGEWSAWLDARLDAKELPPDAERPIGELIAKRIRRAHRAMVERGRTITSDTDAEVLHELRKDAKKLRYLLECFGGLYDPAPRKFFVQRLKSLQDNLGEHQDAEVHVGHLRELSDALAPNSSIDTVLATGQLIERMEQRRITCRNEFAERFAAFDSSKTRDALDAVLASATSTLRGSLR